MTFKIIKTGKACKTSNELCLSLKRDSEGDIFVNFCAWHKNDDGDWIHEAELYFNEFNDQRLAAERFMIDFSELSAGEFLNSFVQ